MSKVSNNEDHLYKIITKEEFDECLARLEKTIDDEIKNNKFNYSPSTPINFLHTAINPKLLHFYQPIQQPPNEILKDDTLFTIDLTGDNDHN